MVRFILADVLCSIVSAALVPLSAAAQDSEPAPWWQMALAQKIEATGGSVKTRRALQSQPKEQVIFSILHRGDTPITADYW